MKELLKSKMLLTHFPSLPCCIINGLIWTWFSVCNKIKPSCKLSNYLEILSDLYACGGGQLVILGSVGELIRFDKRRCIWNLSQWISDVYLTYTVHMKHQLYGVRSWGSRLSRNPQTSSLRPTGGILRSSQANWDTQPLKRCHWSFPGPPSSGTCLEILTSEAS